MDIFKYTVAKQQLLDCKYNKDLEKLLRNYNFKYKSLPRFNKTSSYHENKLIYKLYTLALKLFTTKSKVKLPDFLYNDHINAQRNIIYNLHTSSNNSIWLPLLEYSEFIDFFEFDTVVETPGYGNNIVQILHGIVLDNPLHFKFKFNERLSDFDICALAYIPSYIKGYIHAIRLKQTLSPNTPATVLEQYLEETLAEIFKHKDVSNDITLLQQQLAALQTYQATYGAHCGKL